MGQGSGHSKESWWPRAPDKGEGLRRGKDRTTLPVSCASAPSPGLTSEPEASPMDVEARRPSSSSRSRAQQLCGLRQSLGFPEAPFP